MGQLERYCLDFGEDESSCNCMLAGSMSFVNLMIWLAKVSCANEHHLAYIICNIATFTASPQPH